MKDWDKENHKQKHLFKSIYCGECKQRKSCGKLSRAFCCPCQYQMELEKAQEYSSYQQVYQCKVKEQQDSYQQLKLLREYSGCKQCGSKEVDAYDLYEKGQLICQPCLMSKESGSSSPISFLEQQKWFKRWWKIELVEWLKNFSQLPVNKNCADKWRESSQHLENCDCLEQEAKETYSLFSNSLKESKEKLKKCQCETSKKIRVDSDYYAWCEKCETSIPAASKKRIIKNRNDPKFWGLEIKEKVLCLKCLANYQEKMFLRKKYLFNEYLKRGY